MQAIQLLDVGGPEVMTLREVPTPVPAAGQVLVNMRPTTNGLP
jgi:NADPH:quinone reductase-like Zn-dependent oxidoreductase